MAICDTVVCCLGVLGEWAAFVAWAEAGCTGDERACLGGEGATTRIGRPHWERGHALGMRARAGDEKACRPGTTERTEDEGVHRESEGTQGVRGRAGDKRAC